MGFHDAPIEAEPEGGCWDILMKCCAEGEKTCFVMYGGALKMP